MLENIRITINTSTDQVRLTFKDYVRTYDPISADTNNIIERKPDGIFAPTPNWAVLEDKPSSSVADIDQSVSDRHTHNNKTVIDDLSDDSGVLQYKGLPISDLAALDAKVDKVAGYSLVDDAEIDKLLTVQADATKNSTDAELRDRATHTGEQAISTVTGLQGALDSKVDKVAGSSLITDAEKSRLSTVVSFDNSGNVSALATKVDKEAGKSLIADSEISRLAGVSNYNDAPLALRVTNLESSVGDIDTALAAILGVTP